MKRRTFATGVAWSVPAVTLATAAPAFAASPNATTEPPVPPVLTPIPQGALAVAGVSSAQANFPATNAIDGANGTWWHSQWAAPAPTAPHFLVLEQVGGAPFELGQLTYLPRQDSGGSVNSQFANGTVTSYVVSVADAVAGPWTQVAAGSFTWSGSDRSAKTVSVPAGAGSHRYVRFLVNTAYRDGAGFNSPEFANAAEIRLSQWLQL